MDSGAEETRGAEKLWGQIKEGFKNPGGAICVPVRKVTTKVTPPWLVPGSFRLEGPEAADPPPEGPEAAGPPGASSEDTLEADAHQSQALIYLINQAISHREALLKEDPNAGGHLSVISASDLREALLKEATDGDVSAGEKWCETGHGAMPELGVATMGALLNLASRPPDDEGEEPVPETVPTAEPVIGGLHAATLTATNKAASTLSGMTPFSPFVPHKPPTFAAVSSLPAAVPPGPAADDDKASFTYSYDEEEPGLARAGSAATPLSSSAPPASDCAPAPRLHAAPCGPEASCSFAHSRSTLADEYYYETDVEETALSMRQAAAAAAAGPAAAPAAAAASRTAAADEGKEAKEAEDVGCAPCPPGCPVPRSHALRPHALHSTVPCSTVPCGALHGGA